MQIILILLAFENENSKSIVFVTKHIPAALYKVLGGFATNGINICKLESYLLNGHFFSAQFYIEVEQHIESKALRYAMEELKFFSEEYQILGCYKANQYREHKNKWSLLKPKN